MEVNSEFALNLPNERKYKFLLIPGAGSYSKRHSIIQWYKKLSECGCDNAFGDDSTLLNIRMTRFKRPRLDIW